MDEKIDMNTCQNPSCPRYQQPIQLMAHRGLGYCSVDCKKEMGLDTSSVGTIMFVTREERDVLMESRCE